MKADSNPTEVHGNNMRRVPQETTPYSNVLKLLIASGFGFLAAKFLARKKKEPANETKKEDPRPKL